MRGREKNIRLALPILLLVVGLFFTFIVVTMVESAGFSFRLFTAGPFLLFLGIATLVAPIELPQGEDENDESNLSMGNILKGVPKWKLVVWAAAFIAGIALKDDVFRLFGGIF